MVCAEYGVFRHGPEFSQRHVLPVVQVPVFFRGDERKVRPDKPYGQEERFPAVFQFSDLLYCFIGDHAVLVGVVRHIDAFRSRLGIGQDVYGSRRHIVRLRPGLGVVVVCLVCKRVEYLAYPDGLVSVVLEIFRHGDDFRVVYPEDSVEGVYSGMVGT